MLNTKRNIDRKNIRGHTVCVSFRKPVVDFLQTISEKRKIHTSLLISEIVEWYMSDVKSKLRALDEENKRYELKGNNDVIKKETNNE